MPVRSMTGFGSGRAALDDASVLVELRAVNHRYLDLRMPSGSSFVRLGAAIEPLLKQHLGRGRVEVSVRFESSTGGVSAGPQLDHGRARAAFEELRALRDELDPGAPLPLSLLSSVPGLFSERSPWATDSAPAAAKVAAMAAIEDLDRMRVSEGRRLADDMLARVASLRQGRDRVAARAPEAVAEYRDRLRARLDKLIEDSGVSIDPARLEQELVVYADRVDIAEELTRLQSHFAQFEEILASDDEPVGRKLDFLTQELNRETNTIGSKCSDGPLARVVVDMKTEVERIREQVQNVL